MSYAARLLYLSLSLSLSLPGNTHTRLQQETDRRHAVGCRVILEKAVHLILVGEPNFSALVVHEFCGQTPIHP